MTERLAELFAAAGLDTGLDADAVKEQVVARHGCPRETVYLQERHRRAGVSGSAVRAGRRGASAPRSWNALFGVAAEGRPDDAVGRSERDPLAPDEGGQARLSSPETFVGFRPRLSADPRARRHPLLSDAGRRRRADLRVRSARSTA